MTISVQLRFYQVRSIQGNLPLWLKSFLEPALAAIKAEPVPIEFRPLGRWGGMSSAESNPDRRVQVCTRMLYVSKTSIVRIYVHELTHNLLEGIENHISHGHDAAFCCLNMLLLMRLDDSGIDTGNASNHASSISFYDHQDASLSWKDAPEHIWRPREMEFILRTSAELRKSEMPAIELAKVVHDRYFEFVAELMAEADLKAEQKKLEEARRAKELSLFAKLRSDLFWARCGFFSMVVAFLAVVYFG